MHTLNLALPQHEEEVQKAEEHLRTAKERRKEAQRSMDLLIGDTLKSLDTALSSIEQTEMEWSKKSTEGGIQPKP